jgi:hypothetical protein
MLERLPLDDTQPDDSLAFTRGLSSDDRVALAFRLGDEGARAYADIHGVTPEEAAARLSASRQFGRIPLADVSASRP